MRIPIPTLVVFTIAVIGACGASTHLPVASPADVSRASSRFPDVTATELASGRQLTASRCGGCHAAPEPSSRPANDWPEHVIEMKRRARLDDAEARAIERYLVTMAR